MMKIFYLLSRPWENPILVVRAGALLAILAIIAQRSMINGFFPSMNDPLELRFGALLLMAGLIASTFGPLKPYARTLSPVVLGMLAIWVQYLGYINNMSILLAPFVFFFLILVGYLIEHIRTYRIFFICYALFLILNIFVSNMDHAQRLWLTFAFSLAAVVIYFILLRVKRNELSLQQLNEQLLQSKEMLEEVQGIAKIGMWSLDLQTNVLKLSQDVLSHVVNKPDGCVSLSWLYQKMGPNDAERFALALQESRKTGVPFTMYLTLMTDKGEEVFFRCVAHTLIKGGQAVLHHGILQDVTQETLRERELQKAKDTAEAALQTKSRFLSTMSHEIRTPLNAVIGLSDILLEEDPREDQSELLQTLKLASQNLLGVINDILDYSKLEAGKVNLESIAFNLPQLLDRAIRLFSGQARDKGLTLAKKWGPDLPVWVEGDPTRLLQVLNNLVSNAVKFTPEGGIVCVGAYALSGVSPGCVRFEVSDTGIGIPDGKIAEIFERFSQAQPDTTRRFGGTGLGLTIVRQILQMMGSEIRVESEENVLTRFTFDLKLPLASSVNTDFSSKSALNEKSGIGFHVLVVEDNPVNGKVISRFLEKWGYQVSTAENGEQAVNMASMTPFDLILMDLHLPIIDGYTAAARIRTFDANTPILALTAEVGPEVEARIKRVGIQGVISKPFRSQDLRAKLWRMVDITSAKDVRTAPVIPPSRA